MSPSRSPSTTSPAHRTLAYGGDYLCPVCRHGNITTLTLMDVFACNFCNHLFTANLEQQTLHAADSSQPMAWRWTGGTWRSIHQKMDDTTGLIWFIALVLVIFPPAIIGLCAYMFPPINSTSWNFPILWTGLTFLVHASLVSWLLVEYYQVPAYIALKTQLRQFVNPSR